MASVLTYLFPSTTMFLMTCASPCGCRAEKTTNNVPKNSACARFVSDFINALLNGAFKTDIRERCRFL
ncbi:hypothetical protein EBZ39_13480 [bacterium]|nr:hypothetical protein [bacterium]